jgi:hypothetical protein
MGSIMNRTKIFALAAVCTVLVLNAAPVHAQAHGTRGRVGFGISRGPARAMNGPWAVVGQRGPTVRPIVSGSPLSGSHFIVRPPVRVGYGRSVGYPVAFAGGYIPPYTYPYPYPYQAPYLAVGPTRGSRILGRAPLAIIGRVGARVTRGAARLAFRLLMP